MHYYKATIQYIGTNYAGFQWQNEIKTVQSEINLTLSKLIDGKVTTTAASRTDTGVHAIDQMVKITSSSPIDCPSFLVSLNKLLPEDINLITLKECSGEFKPSVAHQSKEYRYFFTNKKTVSRKDCQFIANISNQLNISEMQFCIQHLIGKHDFCNFYSNGSNVKTTVREILTCELSEINPQDIFSSYKLFKIPANTRKCYQLRIVANGFLKQMIRHIVSGLWMVGSGKMPKEEFVALIDGPKSQKQLWKVASPSGLFLYKIEYGENDE